MNQSDEMFVRDVASDRSQPLQMEKTTLTNRWNMGLQTVANRFLNMEPL